MEKKRVLVTGGRGFLGSAICGQLREKPWVDEVYAPSHAEYDLMDQTAVRKMYEALLPQIVIHCAGHIGGIRDARENPAVFFYENLLIGINTFHGAYLAAVEKFVAIGSACSYPEHAPIPLREETLWDGYPEKVNAPYGEAKKMMIVQGKAYAQQYGFHSIHPILVNLYGPGDDFDPYSSHVIPSTIRKFLEAKEANAQSVTLWGDGSPTREFLYVEDAAEGVIQAAEKYDQVEPFNLGSGREISIKDLATLIARETGYTGDILWDTSMPNGQPRRCMDTSRAEREFGFRAPTSFEEGIRRTIAWWKDHSER